MFCRYLACAIVHLFVLGNLSAVEKEVVVKNTTLSELTLEAKIANNEKVLDQIQKLAEQLDKDAAANMAIRSWQKLFNLLNDEMKSEVQSFFDRLVIYAKNPHGEEPSMQDFMIGILSRASSVCSNNSQESLREELCISVVSSEARTKFYEIFFQSYNQYLSDNTQSVLENINIINIENPSKLLTDRFISMMDEAVKVSIKAVAEELSKYYQIDFRALGIEQPEKPKNSTTKETSK